MLALKIIATVFLGLYILSTYNDVVNTMYANQEVHGHVYEHPYVTITSGTLLRIAMLVVAIVAIWVI